MFKRNHNPAPGGAITLPKMIPARKRSSITVLDFEGLVAHVAQASGQLAGARLTRIEHLPLEIAAGQKEDAQSLGAALKAALDSRKIKAKEVIFGLPRGQVVLRPVQAPMVSDLRELASIINFQIAKDLPFRMEDAIVDFKVLRGLEAPRLADADPAAPPDLRLEALVGAVKKDVLEFYRAVAREAGVKLEGLALRPTGHAHFARLCHAISGDSPALIVGLRADETTLDVVEGGKLVFSRVATATFPENPEARPAYLQAIQIEAVRSLHSYGGTIQKLLILGATGAEKEVAAALTAKLALPAEFPALPNAAPESAAAAAACGLALAALDGTGLPIDFENPKKPAVPRNIKRTQLLVAAAAVVVLLFILIGIRLRLVSQRLEVKQRVQAELLEAEKKLPIYKRLKAQNKIVSGWLSEEQNWLDHLAYLSGILPGAGQIYISAFTTTPQHLIRFSVQARNGELLAELDKKLRAAGYEVKPLSITPANDKHGYNFRTTVELSIPKKMKPGLAKVKAPPRPPDDTPAKTGGSRS